MPAAKAPSLNRKPGLYIAPAGKKGRGLYCRNAIKKGEILEVTPALILNDKDTVNAEPTIINDYTFVIGDLKKTTLKRANINKAADSSAIVMGILAYCNHDEKPNAEIIWDEQGTTLYYMLRATANIKKNTEICTSYGEGWFEDRK